VVKKGRYGPYVSHDGVNATLPTDIGPETVTLEQALPLLDARAARGIGKNKKAPAKKPKQIKDTTSQRGAAANELKATARRKRAADQARKPVAKRKTAKKPAAKAAKPAAE